MATYVRLQEVEHAIGPTGRFALRVTSPEVELRAVDGDTVRATIEFSFQADSDADADARLERLRYEVVPRSGAVDLGEPRQGSGGIASIAQLLGIRGGRVDARVVAEIPAGADVSYNGVAGDVRATGFTRSQEFHTVSGDLVLNGAAGRVRVRGVSSDVTLHADDAVDLEINTVSGDIASIAPRYEALRMTTVSGDIVLEGTLATSGETRIETVSGDVRLGVSGGMTLEVRALSSDVSVGLPHRSEGSRDRRRYVVGDGAARVVFSSMSGDLVASAPRRSVPVAPTPPRPPTPPTAPVPPRAPVPPIPPDEPSTKAAQADQLEILRALERGEIDVDEAAARLAGQTDA